MKLQVEICVGLFYNARVETYGSNPAFSFVFIINNSIEIADSDAVRGDGEACDQNVCLYIAGANGAGNEEMRRICDF